LYVNAMLSGTGFWAMGYLGWKRFKALEPIEAELKKRT
jgi:hypothetical protein